jgi:energy-coupling factor transport system ATP-binding protein
MSSSLLSLSNILVKFKENVILSKVSFEINNGDILHLKGSNGSGKTTLFNCLIRDVDYYGVISWKGKDIKKSKIVNYIFVSDLNDSQLNLTVVELVQYYLDFHGRDANFIKKAIVAIAYVLGITTNLNDFIKVLSKGTLHKLYLLLSLLSYPEVIILDEPFDGLDSESKELFYNLYKMYSLRGGAIIYSSHEQDDTLEFENLVYDLNSLKLTTKDFERTYVGSNKIDSILKLLE